MYVFYQRPFWYEFKSATATKAADYSLLFKQETFSFPCRELSSTNNAHPRRQRAKLVGHRGTRKMKSHPTHVGQNWRHLARSLALMSLILSLLPCRLFWLHRMEVDFRTLCVTQAASVVPYCCQRLYSNGTRMRRDDCGFQLGRSDVKIKKKEGSWRERETGAIHWSLFVVGLAVVLEYFGVNFFPSLFRHPLPQRPYISTVYFFCFLSVLCDAVGEMKSKHTFCTRDYFLFSRPPPYVHAAVCM